MAGINSSGARPEHWLQVSLGARRPESLVWTWLALVGLVGAVILAVVGVPSVDIHGPLHYAGIMDPFCGATRSVYLTMRGQWEAALRYNPAAPLLLVAAVGLVLRAAAGWWTGRWVHLRVPRRAVIVLVVVVGIALEVRQQSIAPLLTAPWTGL
ncbi:DUF2752 domain-containing protein [Mycolicibacterium cosmeticum]|uniref:DUF2752 domain-containing protein n=1 Tax=Mycolicibacterium cosmeticum TaxID=258533 RepID=UPI003204CD13